MFQATEKLGSECVAQDFVYEWQNQPRLLEVSYGFDKKGYDPCTGFWDRKMNWYAGDFDPLGWMVERVLGLQG